MMHYLTPKICVKKHLVRKVTALSYTPIAHNSGYELGYINTQSCWVEQHDEHVAARYSNYDLILVF